MPAHLKSLLPESKRKEKSGLAGCESNPPFFTSVLFHIPAHFAQRGRQRSRNMPERVERYGGRAGFDE